MISYRTSAKTYRLAFPWGEVETGFSWPILEYVKRLLKYLHSGFNILSTAINVAIISK